MKRENEKDFRANIEQGGHASAFVLPDDYRLLAEKTAALLDLDYAGVDLLLGENGPILCEVNSNAYFNAIARVTGVPIAQHYAAHVLEELPC